MASAPRPMCGSSSSTAQRREPLQRPDHQPAHRRTSGVLRSAPADAGRAQRAQCHRGGGGGGRARHHRGCDPPGAARTSPASSGASAAPAATPASRDRRLRASSGGDRRGSGGRQAQRHGPRHRRDAAAPLQPAGQLFNEFCTCCNDADAVIVAPVLRPERHRSKAPRTRRWPRACAIAGTARYCASSPRRAAGLVRGLRRARRHGDFPRCRQHHPVGPCAARPACRARCPKDARGLMRTPKRWRIRPNRGGLMSGSTVSG
jgi:hypothetical protein